MSRTRLEKPYIRKDSNKWYIQYYDEREKRIRETTEIRKDDPKGERKAWKLLECRLEEVERRRELGSLIEYWSAVDQYLINSSHKESSKKSFASAFRALGAFLHLKGITYLEHVNTETVVEFVNWRKAQGIASDTIIFQLRALTLLWKSTFERRGIYSVPPPTLEIRNKKYGLKAKKVVRFATEDEWQRLLDACTYEGHRVIMTVAVETGMRDQELCQLRWSAIRFDNREIIFEQHIVSTKNNRMRVIPMSTTCYDTLLALREGRLPPPYLGPKEPVFHWAGRPYNKNSPWFIKVRDRAGVTGFRFHDIRHTFATRYLNAGGSIEMLSKILGHSSIQMTERYAHFATSSLHRDMERIGWSALRSSRHLDDKK